MKSKMQMNSLILVGVAVMLSILSSFEAQLLEGFYSDSCPQAESIVREEVQKASPMTTVAIETGLIRLFFHDCFARGCDASNLLDSTESNDPNLRAIKVVDSAKIRIEDECQNTVSCADILAFAARDIIKITRGVDYNVLAGRRDGVIPSTAGAFPGQSFASKGFSLGDMVVLTALFNFDQTLLTNPAIIIVELMVKMGNIGVLTGTLGEIRQKCRVIN